jgi:hypothetical protein
MRYLVWSLWLCLGHRCRCRKGQPVLYVATFSVSPFVCSYSPKFRKILLESSAQVFQWCLSIARNHRAQICVVGGSKVYFVLLYLCGRCLCYATFADILWGLSRTDVHVEKVILQKMVHISIGEIVLHHHILQHRMVCLSLLQAQSRA